MKVFGKLCQRDEITRHLWNEVRTPPPNYINIMVPFNSHIEWL